MLPWQIIFVFWTYKYGFFGNTWQQCFHGNTLSCFFSSKVSRCSLHSNPLHRLVLISFSMMPGNKCGNTFFVSWTYKYFYEFFAFHTPAQTELISFSSKAGNKRCHGNTFSCFLGLKVFFGVFFTLQTPAWIGTD